MKRQIIWESHFYEFDSNKNKFSTSDDVVEDAVGFDDENEDRELQEAIGEIGRIIQTPFGLFNVDDAMNPYKQFNFWMAHTNFDITPAVADTIEKMPGIEVLHIFTRYRFIVGIGRAFDGQAVKSAIQKTLCGNTSESNPIEEKVLELQEQLKNYKKWSIYVFPNGSYEYTYLRQDDSNIEEFEKTDSLLREAEQISHGKLITHES